MTTEIPFSHLFTDAAIMEAKQSPHFRYLHSWRENNLLLGGRGTRKSGHLVMKCAIAANVINPGTISYLTEQTASKVRDILVPLVKQLINPDFYTLRSHGQELDIVWTRSLHPGTREPSITRLRSRQAKRIHDDPPFRGPSATWIGHDEIARDRNPLSQDHDPIIISRFMLRGAYGRAPCLDCTTTPVRNWFYDHAARLELANPITVGNCRQAITDEAAAFYTRTRDIDPELYARTIGELDDRFARQELDAEWVALEGRVWTGWRDWNGRDDDTLWPASNRHWHRYDPALPVVWGVDLGGAESAWIVCQRVPAVGRNGVRVMPGDVLVAIGEATPSKEGAWVTIASLIERFRRPIKAYIGADYRTPGTSGETAEMVFAQRRIIAEPITGWRAAKDIQGLHGAAMLCNTAGERRFCVSRDLISLQPRSNRGILSVMEGDQWPDPRDSASYFLKDKGSGAGLEDMRDAWLYLLVGIWPPAWGPTNKFAEG